MTRIWIPGRFPGLNELLALRRTRPGAAHHVDLYSARKRQWCNAVAWTAKAARLPAVTCAQWVGCAWIDDARRVDLDNRAAGGGKLILDGLVLAGVLPDDGWRYVRHLEHRCWTRGEYLSL